MVYGVTYKAYKLTVIRTRQSEEGVLATRFTENVSFSYKKRLSKNFRVFFKETFYDANTQNKKKTLNYFFGFVSLNCTVLLSSTYSLA